MCGIIGIIGETPIAPLLIEALKRLEYRGYDSAGVATLVSGHIDRRRAEGKLVNLEARLGVEPLSGTIAVNYDGYGKWRTVVGAEAFVGSNSSLVAPVRIGRGANVTAGSVVTEDVPAGAVAFGRARQVTKKGQAAPLRAKLRARAAAAKRIKKKK